MGLKTTHDLEIKEYQGSIKKVTELLPPFKIPEYSGIASKRVDDDFYRCVVTIHEGVTPLCEVGFWRNNKGKFVYISPTSDIESLEYSEFCLAWEFINTTIVDNVTKYSPTISEDEQKIFLVLYNKALASLYITIYSISELPEEAQDA